MAGSSYGKLFQITTWGESHGKGLGVVIDGCPAGLPLCEQDIQPFLDRRKPGQSHITTPRKEEDTIEILSGTFEGKTTGTPISLILYNKTQRSGDYSEISNYFRPGHADFTYERKYGFRDYRGGGRSSGRETAGRVAAGAIAVKLLKELGIDILSYTKSIGSVVIDPKRFQPEVIMQNPVYMPDSNAAQDALDLLENCRVNSDSCGGVIECIVKHLPVGIGEPVFEKLNANLAKAICSIGAVKAFEIGDGIEAAKATGLTNNDAFESDEKQIMRKCTNHAGGILGGISDGSDLILRTYFKPTPSVSGIQQTVNRNGETIQVQIKGRHDPVIVPRAVVVVEAMTALTIIDLLLQSMTSQLDSIRKFFQ